MCVSLEMMWWVFEVFEVDCYGFDEVDCKIFGMLIEYYDGGLVGVKVFVVVVGED